MSLAKEIIVKTEDIDFDKWTKLEKSDPEQFEKERKRVIEEFIQGAAKPYQEKLRRLQLRIDAVRERSGNPLSACINISEMMTESVYKEGGLLDSYNLLSAEFDTLTEKVPTKKVAVVTPKKAQILYFPQKNTLH